MNAISHGSYTLLNAKMAIKRFGEFSVKGSKRGFGNMGEAAQTPRVPTT